ncbi:MAG: hypothetical protein H7245_21315, partial [Candidatus Saccharibacteria bacterium]|nr:hypothetical protein [Pseudorhodobacter sp.]
MADIDLRKLPPDEFVLHFGGRPNEVDAFTFSNSLIAIGEALQEINKQLYPGRSVSVTIEGVGPGSFRAKIVTAGRSVEGLFKRRAPDLLVNILASIIFVKFLQGYIDPAPTMQITVNIDSVVVQRGSDRVIIPRNVWDAKERLPKPADVQKHISRTFDVVREDPSVTEFGILSNIHDETPIAIIPRVHFDDLARIEPEAESDETNRSTDQRARLVVLRAIFERSARRWQFVWNGIRISASIIDPTFFDKLASREYVFGQGDILDVT